MRPLLLSEASGGNCVLGLWHLPIHSADRRVLLGPPAIQAPPDEAAAACALSSIVPEKRAASSFLWPQPSAAPKLTFLFKSRLGQKR